MIDSTFVEKIVAIAAKPFVVEAKGHKNVIVPTPDGGWDLFESLSQPIPEVEPLLVNTLQGLLDWVNCPEGKINGPVVHVVDPNRVSVRSNLEGDFS